MAMVRPLGSIVKIVWDELQVVLDANASSETHTNLGPGQVILQGLSYNFV